MSKQQFYTLLLLIVIAVGLVSSLIGYEVGLHNGQQYYLINNCTRYPFVLLDPNQYVACKLP